MSEALQQTAQVGAALAARWLGAERGVEARVAMTPAGAGSPPVLRMEAGGAATAVAVVPLYDVAGDATTLHRKAAWETRLSELGVAPCVVWTPPLAELPDDAGDHYAGRIAEAVGGLAAGERTEVAFPVELAVRRVGDDGAYLSALGGVQPHWARFTNQVLGEYRLDSTAIHRLPEEAAAVTQLIDLIVLVANGLRTVGQTATIPASDTWAVQRLDELPGPVVIAASPETNPAEGRPVRKAMRSGAREAAEALAAAERTGEAAARALVFVGVFRSMAEETASTALRGMDPLAYRGFDLVGLAADARFKPLFVKG